MAIQIFNSKTKTLENFEPIHPGEVRMYVCGPTVYDLLHVGNFRGPIFFNVVRNWFEKSGFKVSFVYNYTDVDDRIIQRAQKDGVASAEISEKYIVEFEKDYKALKLRPHTHNPKVTEFMQQIIDFVKQLIERGKAYVVDGDVYFDVKSFPTYGQLSHKNLEDLETGVRIDVDERKKHPADFALWKKSKADEPSWPSPWSAGRPGWHIECSAMSRALLGDQIDIHGGGLDLIFPHHENEVAQSEGATGKQFVHYWMHNNMLEFGSQKMSKSLGNVRTARSFLQEYNAEILKYLMLSAHYRSILDFSPAQIEKCVSGLARFYSALAHAEKTVQMTSGQAAKVAMPANFAQAVTAAEAGIAEAMDDDFNTAEVLARLFEVVRVYNHLLRAPGTMTPQKAAIAQAFLRWLPEQGQLLALFQEPAVQFLRTLDDMLLNKKGLQRAQVDQLVLERARARAAKDFAKSDELRGQLQQMGIAVQDTPQGSEWEVHK